MRIHTRNNNVQEVSALGQPLRLSNRTYYSGTFRIHVKETYKIKDDLKLIEIELHNSSGEAYALCNSRLLTNAKLKQYELVQLLVYKNNTDTNQLYVQRIVRTNNLINIHSILSLPRKLAANPNWLDRLINLRESITSTALGKFIDMLFSDNDIALAFIQVPASKNFHHNHLGGLLAHSVEVAEITGQQSYKNNDEREIAVVAALLHDIGKVRTLKPDISTTQLGKMVAHDDLTLEICASALKELDKTWPEASYTMRHVWTCASSGAKYGFERNCSIANIIQFADRQSVDRFNESHAFESNNKIDGLAWNGSKYFWRPTAELHSKNRSVICLKLNTH